MAFHFSGHFFKGLACIAVLVLAACDPAPPVPKTAIPLRNPTAPIASQVDVTLDRLQGDWRVMTGAGIAPGSHLKVKESLILIDGVEQSFSRVGPGRFKLGDEDIWVHWLDINNRTAALGNPSGARVWIMDRQGKPSERLQAARKILEWYGYDLSRMKSSGL